MPRFRNASPLGALEVPILGHRVVELGEVIEVPDDLLPAFAGQPSWEPTNKETREAVEAVLEDRVAGTIAEPAPPRLIPDSFAASSTPDAEPAPPAPASASFVDSGGTDDQPPAPAPAAADFTGTDHDPALEEAVQPPALDEDPAAESGTSPADTPEE